MASIECRLMPGGNNTMAKPVPGGNNTMARPLPGGNNTMAFGLIDIRFIITSWIYHII